MMGEMAFLAPRTLAAGVGGEGEQDDVTFGLAGEGEEVDVALVTLALGAVLAQLEWGWVARPLRRCLCARPRRATSVLTCDMRVDEASPAPGALTS